MLSGLQDEINLHPELTGACKEIVINTLNEPGSALVESWKINPEQAMISKNELYTHQISDATFRRLIDYLETDKYMAERIHAATDFNMSSPAVRSMMGALYTGGIATEAEYNSLLRLGEIKLSRAEELFGRKITTEDFE